MRHFSIVIVLLSVALLAPVSASAGISKIRVYNEDFSPGTTIPVFVDSTRNSIRVIGQFMDLCTGVQSSDSSFVVTVGDRSPGTNSSVEILVAANNAPDLDEAIITIKFLSGQETFRIKAYKSKITKMEILGKGTSPTCQAGETLTLAIEGHGLDHVALGPTARMMEIADLAEGGPHYTMGAYSGGATSARVPIQCTKSGVFSIVREWFWDKRLAQYTSAPFTVVRGSAPRISVTVTAPPTPIKRPAGA
ncbi:MAG TPA: hypothetical protein VNM92_18070 [Thermoanaerobaculia bacterium]|nr:hypothetical protein [Thermoanaerobaculia bacterium]